MIAENNKTYAQIINDKCHWIFTATQLPEWNESDIHAVDVTNLDVETGDVYANGIFSKPVVIEPTLAELAELAKARRLILLEDTDWTQLRDIPTLTSDKYSTYRQDLRDITIQAGYPTTIVWPTLPI